MKTRDWIVIVSITLVIALCLAARRKPEDLVCAADTYARAATQMLNLKRQGRGQAPLACTANDPGRWER